MKPMNVATAGSRSCFGFELKSKSKYTLFKTTVELAGFGNELSPFLFLPETNLYLRLEKVLGPADADLVDVDLALPRQHPQPRVLAQLARRRLTEDQQELAEGDVTVVVLVYLLMV